MATGDSNDYREGPPVRLRLNTVRNCRLSLARVSRMYAAGEIPAVEARTMTYLITQLLGWFRLESDLEIERRIATIEEKINQMEKSA